MRMKGRVGSLLVAATVFAAACAGAESEQPGASAVGQENVDVEARGPVGLADPAVRRELGLLLRPESDVPANPLPPVEVHDVGQDRMVNFKNIFPAERPVLLWMWAPY